MNKTSLADLRVAGNTAPSQGHHDRAWWRAEARRLNSDWPGILRLQAEVVAGWRARNDPETGTAA
jgi:hypothetical protein